MPEEELLHDGNSISFDNILNNCDDYFAILYRYMPEVENVVDRACQSPVIQNSFQHPDDEPGDFDQKVKSAVVLAAFTLGTERFIEVLEENIDTTLTALLGTIDSAIQTGHTHELAGMASLINLSASLTVENYPKDPQRHYEEVLEYLDLSEKTREFLAGSVQLHNPTLH